MNKRLFGETDGIRGFANKFPLDVATIVNVGRAIGEYVVRTVEPNPARPYKVLIGKDTRRSGYMIEQALTAGLLSRGVDVIAIGPAPTPAISHLVESFALDLAIQITASHNPYTDNGIKIFKHDGSKLTDEEELEIENLYFTDNFADIETVGRAARIEDATGRYIEFVKATVNNVSLKGFTIVVDCANGAAYKIAPTVFEELGAKVISIGDQPNGYNINKECGALYIDKVREKVLETGADLGIALDGDADRVIMVDEVGHIIDGDYVMSMIAVELKRQGKLAKNTLVTTKYSNYAMIEYLEQNGINVNNSIVNGDRPITELCRNEGYNLGGEQSGHYILMDYAETGDGTMSALVVLKAMKESNKKLSELAYKFEKYPQTQEIIKVEEKTPLENIPGFNELITKWEKEFGKFGRTLIRYSGTEKKLRVMVEAKDKKLLNDASKEILNLLNKYFNK